MPSSPPPPAPNGVSNDALTKLSNSSAWKPDDGSFIWGGERYLLYMAADGACSGSGWGIQCGKKSDFDGVGIALPIASESMWEVLKGGTYQQPNLFVENGQTYKLGIESGSSGKIQLRWI